MTDLVVIGHGSRDPAAADEFAALLDLIERRLPDQRVAGGFLELADPSIDDAIDKLVGDGAVDVVAVPYVLFGAGHLKDDGPAVLARARRRHAGVEFRLARDLGIHPAILDVAEERTRSVLDRLGPGDDRGAVNDGEGGGGGDDSMVVLAGRGSTDPDACADFVKLARLLGEGRGLPAIEPAFVAMARPSIAAALNRAYRLGARRIAVVPLFLFSGVLVDRIAEHAASWAADHPDTQVVTGGPLGPDARLADLVIERFGEPQHGDVRMNCDVCSYRVRLPGYEERVGMPLSLAPADRAPRGWRARRAANQAAEDAAGRRERPRLGLGRRRAASTAVDR
ncbi:MAG TPA: sirohydrochlorin chelatase, partial [Acidimicrobiales bacterium]